MKSTSAPHTSPPNDPHTVIVQTMAHNLQMMGMQSAGLHIAPPRGLPQLLKKAAPQTRPLIPSKLHANA